MHTYNLKDKITITKEFLNELEAKSWQEIEYIQNQIANIKDTHENTQLAQLLKNLLTSYYIFVGGIENINTNNSTISSSKTIKQSDDLKLADLNNSHSIESFENTSIGLIDNHIEPFEYFVDFDEPFGEPISDEDLYGKNK